LAIIRDRLARRSFGDRTYRRKAELCQRPKVWIVESSNPTKAAVVAAPIRKLCPANWSWGSPMALRQARTRFVKPHFVTGFPVVSRKKGPAGNCFLMLTKFSMANTGHVFDPVIPTMMSAPLPNWSVLDFLR